LLDYAALRAAWGQLTEPQSLKPHARAKPRLSNDAGPALENNGGEKDSEMVTWIPGNRDFHIAFDLSAARATDFTVPIKVDHRNRKIGTGRGA
jgi:hypothetical protein